MWRSGPRQALRLSPARIHAATQQLSGHATNKSSHPTPHGVLRPARAPDAGQGKEDVAERVCSSLALGTPCSAPRSTHAARCISLHNICALAPSRHAYTRRMPRLHAPRQTCPALCRHQQQAARRGAAPRLRRPRRVRAVLTRHPSRGQRAESSRRRQARACLSGREVDEQVAAKCWSGIEAAPVMAGGPWSGELRARPSPPPSRVDCPARQAT